GVVKSGESVGEEFAVEQRAIDTNVHEQSSVAPARVGGGVERYRDAPTVEFGMGKRARVLAPPMEPVRARFGFGDPFELVGRVLAVDFGGVHAEESNSCGGAVRKADIHR